MKKLVTLFLALLMVIAVMPTSTAEETPMVITIARGGDTTTIVQRPVSSLHRHLDEGSARD